MLLKVRSQSDIKADKPRYTNSTDSITTKPIGALPVMRNTIRKTAPIEQKLEYIVSLTSETNISWTSMSSE